MANAGSGLLTVEDIADRLNTSPQTVRRMMRNREMPHVKLGRRLYCPVAAFEEFIAEQLQEAE